ncbi:MAG TPA: serine/threonine-protein kinase [Ktedonobacteraceae bacterium]|nr:serine/threonine-protein kinase [Ktedonobacteraceae bacterium]
MRQNPLGDWQGRLIGRYQLVHLLGAGGMSEVWLATDTQLHRQVALKMLPMAANDRAYLQAFAYEARAAAALEHPHILSVHDFGEQEIEGGEIIPYLVMPYVPGGTLANRLYKSPGPLPVQECLHYLRQAAQAIDYAHSKRVLHRDIKPANMLLREDNWLLLTDFGIAKVLNTSLVRTQTNAGSGTPGYMAPEQVMGQAQPASDIYSLAVVAYQLFTGRQPFHGANAAETISMHLQMPPPPPRQFNPQIPPSVENLLLMALAKDPRQRPPSCAVLVDSLRQAWMKEMQTIPGPDADGKRRGTSATLLPPYNAASSVQVPVRPSGTPVPASGPDLPDPTILSPKDGFRPGENVADPSIFSFPTTTPKTEPPVGVGPLERRVGRRAILIGGGVAAALTIGGGVFAYERLHGPGSLPGLQTGLTTPTPGPGPRRLVAGIPVLKLTGHTDEVWTASWDPTGRYLMTAGKDAYIMLWDIGAALQSNLTGAILTTPMYRRQVAGIKFEDLVDAVCWSPDGQKIVVGNDFADKVYVLDAFSPGKEAAIYSDVDAAASGGIAIYTNVFPGPHKNQFTVINQSQAQVWNFDQLDQPAVNYDTSPQNVDINKASWSPGGSMLAGVSEPFGSSIRQLLLWTAADHVQPQFTALPQRNQNLTSNALADTIAWSPRDPHLLLISDGDISFVWDIQQEKPRLTLGASVSPFTPVIGLGSWSPNGRYVAASYDRLGFGGDWNNPLTNPPIFVWDIQMLLSRPGASNAVQQPTLTFASPGKIQHTKSILDLEWSPDGRYIATSSVDTTVIIWKVDAS